MESMRLEERIDSIYRSLEDAMIGGYRPNARTCMKALEMCMSDVTDLLMEPMHADPQWVAALNDVKEQLKRLMHLLDRFLDMGVSDLRPVAIEVIARTAKTSSPKASRVFEAGERSGKRLNGVCNLSFRSSCRARNTASSVY
jgi:hypothetical protein